MKCTGEMAKVFEAMENVKEFLAKVKLSPHPSEESMAGPSDETKSPYESDHLLLQSGMYIYM